MLISAANCSETEVRAVPSHLQRPFRDTSVCSYCAFLIFSLSVQDNAALLQVGSLCPGTCACIKAGQDPDPKRCIASELHHRRPKTKCLFLTSSCTNKLSPETNSVVKTHEDRIVSFSIRHFSLCDCCYLIKHSGLPPAREEQETEFGALPS